MVGIVSTGIGSGLDVAGLVSQLVAAEAEPAQARFARQEAGLLAEVSAFGSLKSALSQFQAEVDKLADTDQLLGRQVLYDEENAPFSVAIDPSAPPSQFDVTVESVATAQRLASSAFVDATSEVGFGQLTISAGDDAFVLAINADATSLADIQDAINNATDNTFVRATLVNTDAGTTLSLSALSTGSAGEISIVSSGGDGGLAALDYDAASNTGALTEIRAGTDAEITVDGLSLTSSSNTIANAVEGVTLELLRAEPGAAQGVAIEFDQNALRANVDAFVNAYNALIDTIRTQTAFDSETNTAGILLGDNTLRNISTQLRREFTALQGDAFDPIRSLADVGVTLDVDGKASLDADVFNEAVDGGFVAIGQLFATTGGVAERLGERLTAYLDDAGPIETRTNGLNASIDDIDEQRQSLNERLVILESRLFSQFNALDSLISQLSNTSAFLTQQLAQLPGSSGNNS
ncbi:MAG: flagellar filament capping protein FliD [Pseudomonadota bacterium]